MERKIKKVNTEKINTEDVNEIIDWGKKILHLLYIVLFVGVVLGVVLFCKNFGVFEFLGGLLKVLSPLFIGFIIAWLFNPLVQKLKKKGIPKVLAALIVYAILIFFIVILIKIFIPIVYSQLNDFVGMIPNIIKEISGFISRMFERASGGGIDFTTTKENMLANITGYANSLSSNLPTTVLNGVKTLFSGLGTFAIALVIGLYMLFDFDKLSDQLIKIFPRKNQREIFDLLNDIGTEVRKCVNGILLVACMVFVCDTVGFSIIGLDGALLFGLFCGITDLIPYIGPYIGAGVAGLIGFTQGPLIGIGVLIIALIVQIMENYVLQPIVMSKATEMHPVVIMVGLLVFGHFFGILGMILATPTLSILKVIYRFLVKKFDLFSGRRKQNIAGSSNS
jgi:predicted PurR-regulated permease PerM